MQVAVRAQARRGCRRWLSLMPPKEAFEKEQIETPPLRQKRRDPPQWSYRSAAGYLNPAKHDELQREINEQIALNHEFKHPSEFDPIWLVFDVNGTLGSRTSVRKKREAKNLQKRLLLRPRPYVGHMLEVLKMCGYFNLALWSSANAHNVVRSVALLENLGGITFDRVLSRLDSTPKPTEEDSWGTVKPLSQKGFDELSRVLLIDDSLEKAWVGEEKNLVLVPAWQENNDDFVLLRLTKELLRLPREVDNDGDVREFSERISNTLVGHEGEPVPFGEW